MGVVEQADGVQGRVTGTPLVHYGSLWYPGLEAIEEQPEAPVAVLVCHGMGQQVRYETISSIAEAIRQEAQEQHGTADEIQVHLARETEDPGADFLARAEVNWKDQHGTSHRVHVYEAYWAPLTEGRITYRDTIAFLLSGAWKGLRFSKLFRPASFQRWMFGGPKPLAIGRATFLALLGAVLVVVIEAAFAAFVSLDVASRIKDVVSQPRPSWPGLPAAFSFLGSWLLQAARSFPGCAILWDRQRWFDPLWFGALGRLLVWLLAILGAFLWRSFIIQYVGDVAAYVSPYKDSKFDELRHRIQRVGLDVGKVIYGFGPPRPTVPKYARIVVVGHSLGSVLAYDTLNALINQDNVSGQPDRRDVIRRTRALITFGSPLDKTAFIFRMQFNTKATQIREQLAASVQPLIVDYGLYRPASFKWVNIWSRQDVISGQLDYYDDPRVPAGDARHVENMVDPDASVPLLAHVQYWNNRMLRRQLFRFVQ
jgi:hypothetical protein